MDYSKVTDLLDIVPYNDKEGFISWLKNIIEGKNVYMINQRQISQAASVVLNGLFHNKYNSAYSDIKISYITYGSHPCFSIKSSSNSVKIVNMQYYQGLLANSEMVEYILSEIAKDEETNGNLPKKSIIKPICLDKYKTKSEPYNRKKKLISIFNSSQSTISNNEIVSLSEANNTRSENPHKRTREHNEPNSLYVLNDISTDKDSEISKKQKQDQDQVYGEKLLESKLLEQKTEFDKILKQKDEELLKTNKEKEELDNKIRAHYKQHLQKIENGIRAHNEQHYKEQLEKLENGIRAHYEQHYREQFKKMENEICAQLEKTEKELNDKINTHYEQQLIKNGKELQIKIYACYQELFAKKKKDLEDKYRKYLINKQLQNNITFKMDVINNSQQTAKSDSIPDTSNILENDLDNLL